MFGNTLYSTVHESRYVNSNLKWATVTNYELGLETYPEQVDMWDTQIEQLIIELCDTRTNNQIDTYLKARLRNAFIIKQSLTAGDKARKSLKRILERKK